MAQNKTGKPRRAAGRGARAAEKEKAPGRGRTPRPTSLERERDELRTELEAAQGVVVLEAIINKQGSVENLRVVNGHPLLIQAALDAVKQWKYKPTLLNGEPVEVVTQVTVNFNLSG